MKLRIKTPHTGAQRNKRVRVLLRDGGVICDRFVDRCDKYVFLKDFGRLHKREIRSLSTAETKHK